MDPANRTPTEACNDCGQKVYSLSYCPYCGADLCWDCTQEHACPQEQRARINQESPE